MQKRTVKKETNTIYDQYFNITQQYADKYGTNTILFYQVGAFFEMYGIQMDKGDVIKSQIEPFTQIAQLNMSAKEIHTEEGAILMAGFRDYSLDKYLKIATNNGFTAVVYVQNMTNPKNITRELHGIYSPGTFISYDTDSSQQLSNNIICVWLTTYKNLATKTDQLVCGISTAHIFTGETSMFEYDTNFIMNPTTFDELERYISVISPNEAIIISTLSDKQTNTVLQYSGLRTNTIHKIILETEQNIHKIELVEKCQKQVYINHVLSSFFGDESFQICAEFHTNMIATQSFCFLLHFLQEHNADLVRKIKLPAFNHSQNRMVLANHTLKQLNIIDDDTIDGKKSGKFSSVLSFLNKCCNPMGRRVFQKQLTNPVFDEEWLNKEYDMTARFLNKSPEYLQTIRKQLAKIKDLEKISRQIVVNKIYPNSIYLLYDSIKIIHSINQMVDGPEIAQYLQDADEAKDTIEHISAEILSYINTFLIIEKCKNIESVANFSENIIQRGISRELDTIYAEYENYLQLFDRVRETFNNIMKTNAKDDTEYIKIHETEKSGATLQITKKRGEQLRQSLKLIKKDVIEFSPDLIVPIKDIRFIKASASNEEIEFPQFSNILKHIHIVKEKISAEISNMFSLFLRTLEKDWYEKMEVLIQWTIKLDIIICKTYIANKYNYCRPTIQEKDQSFFDVEGLRHVLIEHIQTNELYVTNDLDLSDDTSEYNGILIFGTNAVGKTSFIRAIGIVIIMAQSGIYVPCSKFTYKPYTAIFSRILGNDNIFKGLSTFAVEMSELRIILKMADKNSLVLGDELCSGTEIESALSLFSSGLIELHEKCSTFLFATHFHEIAKYDEIRALYRMGLKHMAVHYDKSMDSLVYDRILKDGQGSRMYGLEVCKSLYMDPDFLERAYTFRNKYFMDQTGKLNDSPSHFNAKKIRGLCEICKTELAEETHHLSPQCNADDKGFIGSFHKNHTANLAGVCEKCHNEIHENGKTITKTKKKTTKGYMIA